MPFDGHFGNGNPELFGEQEQFDIKYPCSKVLCREYLLCGAPREELEATLGITDMSNADYAEDGMQSVHEDISKDRTLSTHTSLASHPTTQTEQDMYTYLDDRRGLDEMRSTPYHDRRLILGRQLIHRRPKRLEILKPTRPVRVDHQEAVTACVEHPMAHRPAFPKVFFEGDDADLGGVVLGSELEGEGGCAVFGAVVDDKEFVRACGLGVSVGRGLGWGRGRGRGRVEVREGALEHGREPARFVVGRNDDAQVERPLVGERGQREGCRRGLARAVCLFRGPCDDGGRREEDEG